MEMQIPCGMDSSIQQKESIRKAAPIPWPETFKDLARSRKSEILKGHMLVAHLYMLISIPSKYAVAQVIEYIKEKSTIHIARNYLGRRRNFTG
jgi:putative transposase